MVINNIQFGSSAIIRVHTPDGASPQNLVEENVQSVRPPSSLHRPREEGERGEERQGGQGEGTQERGGDGGVDQREIGV